MIYKPSVSSMYKSQYFNFNLEEVCKKSELEDTKLCAIIEYAMNMQWLEIWAWISCHSHNHVSGTWAIKEIKMEETNVSCYYTK